MKNQNGFTILELIMVVCIISILVAILAGSMRLSEDGDIKLMVPVHYEFISDNGVQCIYTRNRESLSCNWEKYNSDRR